MRPAERRARAWRPTESAHSKISFFAPPPQARAEPAWSPDGRRIAFTSFRDGNAEVYVMDADGAHAKRLTTHPLADNAPAWLAEVSIRIRARQFREGMAAVDKALGINPNDAEAHYQKGSVLHVQGDLKAAMAAYPGWRATVNGRPQTIFPTDGALRGVTVPEGTSRVEFRYAPKSTRPANSSGSIRCTSRTRASSSRSARRATPKDSSRPCAPTRRARTARLSVTS